MPVNRINIGFDYSFGYYEANTGQIIDFGDIQSFKEDMLKHDVASHPYNGLPRFGYVPAGHRGTFTIKRVGSQLDSLAIQLKNIFYAGANVQAGYISRVTNNGDGTISQWQYTLAVFWLNQVSSGSREREIDQEVEWMASDLIQLS